jgi:phosphonate transport system permease protein
MIEMPVRREGEARRRAPSGRRPALVNGRTLSLLAFLIALVWSIDQAGLFERDVVNEGGWTIARRFAQASLRPDLSPELLRLTLQSALITLAYAVCGTALSLLIGLPGGILSSEVWWQSRVPPAQGAVRASLANLLPWLFVRGGLAVPRAIHEAIWGLFFINLFGLDPLSAVLAIAIPFGAITAKVFAEIFDETPPQPLQALLAGGAGRSTALLYGLLPQAFPYLLSYALYRFECALRSAVVLGLIGAGGLGYQILLSLQSLRYEQIWTFLYALILLVGLTDAWSSFLNRRLNVSSATGMHAAPPAQRTAAVPGARANPGGDRGLRHSLIAAALLIPFSFWYVRADWTKLPAARTAERFAGVLSDAFPPRLEPALLGDLWHLSTQTLAMSILAITVAGVGGLLFSYPAAANFVLPGGIRDIGGRGKLQTVLGAAVLLLARGALLVTRALSESIWVLIVLFVLFPGILPGAIGLGLYNLGVLGRLMAEVTENVDNRPLRALIAQGASPPQVFLYGVLPKTLPRCVSYILYRWEVCIRATAIVGIVGAGGLGRRLSEQLTRFDYPAVVTTLLFFIGLTFLVDLISATVRRTLR